MKLIKTLVMFALLAELTSATAEDSKQPITPQPAFPLWTKNIPYAKGNTPRDIPTLQAFIPKHEENSSMTAILICPGGAYAMLADGHEGKDYAHFFNLQGKAAFVLKYRLGTHGYKHPVMLTDVSRAIRIIRSRAKEYGIDPNRIGVMGSSAGGHLAATLITKFTDGDSNSEDPVERVSSRPDFGILCYPVITMGEKTHTGSRENLLGRNPSKELIRELSLETQVTPKTPKCFIWHTAADEAVPVENSILFASALAKNGVPFALHIYQNGPHGQGLKAQFPYQNALPWGNELTLWLKENNL